MSYPEGAWIVDAWVEGPVYPSWALMETVVWADDIPAAIVKASKQLGHGAGAPPVVVSVRRVDMNYPGQTFAP